MFRSYGVENDFFSVSAHTKDIIKDKKQSVKEMKNISGSFLFPYMKNADNSVSEG